MAFSLETSQSRTRSAKANSEASTANPKNMAAQPGPGSTSIAMPAITIVNPSIKMSGLRTVTGVRHHARLNLWSFVMLASIPVP